MKSGAGNNIRVREIWGAILRGVVEHQDPGYFLGSLMALGEHLADMCEAGWLEVGEDGSIKATSYGEHIYKVGKLDQIPKGRWTFYGDMYGSAVRRAVNSIEKDL